MQLRHVIEAQQFDRSMLEELFYLADEMKEVVAKGGSDMLHRKIMATLFYEPSTRTRLSFESAMIRLGGKVIGTESASHFSSAAKGETLEDTIRVISGYADVIVLRHDTEGASARAVEVCPDYTHIVNAGDGPGQHPTQALLDLFTIDDLLGTIDGKKIALVGDLKKGRTVRSLAYLVAKFNNVLLHLVSGEHLRMRDDILDYLTRHNVHYEIHTNLAEIAGEVDVVYMTRLQRERHDSSSQATTGQYYAITPDILSAMKKNAIILHPLPRNEEIPQAVDSDPRAAYFRQSQNGLYVRMAILSTLFS